MENSIQIWKYYWEKISWELTHKNRQTKKCSGGNVIKERTEKKKMAGGCISREGRSPLSLIFQFKHCVIR